MVQLINNLWPDLHPSSSSRHGIPKRSAGARCLPFGSDHGRYAADNIAIQRMRHFGYHMRAQPVSGPAIQCSLCVWRHGSQLDRSAPMAGQRPYQSASDSFPTLPLANPSLRPDALVRTHYGTGKCDSSIQGHGIDCVGSQRGSISVRISAACAECSAGDRQASKRTDRVLLLQGMPHCITTSADLGHDYLYAPRTY